MRGQTIKVYLRIKPPASDCIFVDKNSQGLLHYGNKVFGCDGVFGAQCQNSEIYERMGKELVENTLAGYNSCLFAYGQTGTGKTLTMTGNHEQEGLVQRCFKELLEKLYNTKEIDSYEINMTFLEIYNENINDLLNDRRREISVREKPKSHFYVEGLLKQRLDGWEDFQQALRECLARRVTRQTLMNQSSSRSHSILTLQVTVRIRQDQLSCITRNSKLHFIDLAGSEKLRDTGAKCQQLKQANNINQSLLNLGRVVSTLAQGTTKSFVPFRDSVLTKILKDSLGGNSRNTFIGTLSARKEWIGDTIATILFLGHAKKVKNQTQANETIEQKTQEQKTAKKQEPMEIQYMKSNQKAFRQLTDKNYELSNQIGRLMSEKEEQAQKFTQMEQLLTIKNTKIEQLELKIVRLEIMDQKNSKQSKDFSMHASQSSIRSVRDSQINNFSAGFNSQQSYSFWEQLQTQRLEHAQQEEQLLARTNSLSHRYKQEISQLKDQIVSIEQALQQSYTRELQLKQEVTRMTQILAFSHERSSQGKRIQDLQFQKMQLESKLIQLNEFIDLHLNVEVKSIFVERDELFQLSQSLTKQLQETMVKYRNMQLQLMQKDEIAGQMDLEFSTLTKNYQQAREQLQRNIVDFQQERRIFLEERNSLINENQGYKQKNVELQQKLNQIQKIVSKMGNHIQDIEDKLNTAETNLMKSQQKKRSLQNILDGFVKQFTSNNQVQRQKVVEKIKQSFKLISNNLLQSDQQVLKTNFANLQTLYGEVINRWMQASVQSIRLNATLLQQQQAPKNNQMELAEAILNKMNYQIEKQKLNSQWLSKQNDKLLKELRQKEEINYELKKSMEFWKKQTQLPFLLKKSQQRSQSSANQSQYEQKMQECMQKILELEQDKKKMAKELRLAENERDTNFKRMQFFRKKYQYNLHNIPFNDKEPKNF